MTLKKDGKEFNLTTSSFRLDNTIIECDINEKYILASNYSYQIEVYSSESFKKLFSHNIYSLALHIKFHPLYYNIFSATLSNSNVLLFNIDTKTNNLEEKFQYLCSGSNRVIKTIFSPYSKGNFLATLSYENIKIWNITKYSNKNIIGINIIAENASNYPIKWSESGEYLIYQKNEKKIEIFSIKSNSVKYYLNYEANDFYFLEKSEEIITLNDNIIIIWDAKNEKKKYENINIGSFIRTLIDYDKSNIYLMGVNKISIYNFRKGIQILEHKIKKYIKFFLLKNIDNIPGLFSKLLFSHFTKKEFELLSIFSSIDKSHNIIKLIEAPNNFWNNSIGKINNNFEFLSYQYNQIENSEIHKKNYLSIDGISDELNKLIKNKTLEERRIMVHDYMKDFQEHKDIYIAYLNYVNNLIKDNTNIDLLSNYLKFIKKNNDLLNSKYGNAFENFNDEMKQYQALFEQTQFYQEFKYIKGDSENEKLLKLFTEIASLNIDNKDSLNKFIISKKSELESFLYNQPISFENNKELFYCKNKIVILTNLEKLINNEKYDLIDNMKYSIQEIIKRNFLDKYHIKNNNIYNMFILILIAIPQIKIITDYNLNLIDNEGIDVNENELIKLGFQYDKSTETYKKDNLIIKKEEIKYFNLKNLILFIKTPIKEIFQIYELYKYEYLSEYYKKKFDEDKFRNFISKILVSNVFKEAFSFFYGNDIKYPFMDKNNNMTEEIAKKFLDTHLNFIPLKSLTTFAVTEKFSMETYIFLDSNFISSSVDVNENNLSMDEELINKALTNGAIVAINEQEINHNFHNYYYFSKNGNETLRTPRKFDLNGREDGNNMAKILFGKVLNNLTLKQALYILNEKNYEKSLNQFSKEFLELKEEHCKSEGIFKEYFNKIFNVKELSDYMAINFKSNKNKIGYISIKLKNDVLGFPNFDENVDDEDEF